MKATEENNRLIAEFMGYETYEHTDSIAIRLTEGNEFNSEVFGHVHTKFHTSLDWLMPVVEKINSLFGGEINTLIISNACRIYSDTLGIYNEMLESNSTIEAVYQAVVQFIEWYNENK